MNSPYRKVVRVENFIAKVNLGKLYYWNPWRGCKKVSEACENCFIRRHGSIVATPANAPKAAPGSVILLSLQTDFFIKEADHLRAAAWKEIKERQDCIFFIITKRAERIKDCLPDDWGDGYDNVAIAVTAENQARADERIPLLLDLPVKHKWVTCSPCLEAIDLSKYIDQLEFVEACGEKGDPAVIRPTYYEWVEQLSTLCKEHNVRFSLMHIGHKFIKDGNILADPCNIACYHSINADSLQLDNGVPIKFNLGFGEYTIE